jgi:predicted nucleic acid-binding protein
MPRYVVDTNIYVRATRDEEWSNGLERFFSTFASELYLHSIVALEILAGATNPDLERRTQDRFIRPFERRGRVITPSHGACKRAGAALAQLVHERKASPGRGIKESLVNDCLIAASALDHGFILVTDNARDYGLVRDILPLVFVEPWPDPARQ